MLHLRVFLILLALPIGGACSKENVLPASASYQVYVTNELSGDVTIIDGASLAVAASEKLGARARGIVASREGNSVYVALTGSPISPPGADASQLPQPNRSRDGIAVINVATGKLARIIRGISDPEQLAIDANGHVYGGSEAAGSVIMNLGGAAREIVLGGDPEGVAVTPDGATLLATLEEDNELVRIDVATGSVTGRVVVGARPRSVAIASDGQRAFVANENDGTVSFIDLGTFTQKLVATPTGLEPRPMGVAISPDDRTIYVTTGRGGDLVALDAQTGEVRGVAHIGGRPWGVALSPDGKLAFAANGLADELAVVDVDRMTVTKRIKVGTRPWGVAIVSQ